MLKKILCYHYINYENVTYSYLLYIHIENNTRILLLYLYIDPSYNRNNMYR